MYRNCTATQSLRTPTTFSVHYYMVKSHGWREELQPNPNVCIFSFHILTKEGSWDEGGGRGSFVAVCRKEGLFPWTVWLPQTDRCEGAVPLG